jgi:hypothetical protein
MLKTVTSNQLRQYLDEYYKQFDGLNEADTITTFTHQLRNYLDTQMKTEDYFYEPYKYLINSAKMGLTGAIIYQGSFPTQYQNILEPVIKKYIIKYFSMPSFDGFGLMFLKSSKLPITIIKLVWNNTNIHLESPTTSVHLELPKPKHKSRSKEMSKSKDLPSQLRESAEQELLNELRQEVNELKEIQTCKRRSKYNQLLELKKDIHNLRITTNETDRN